MKAVTTTGQGSIELTDVPTPVPGDGEVLVRVAAATVNPVDTVFSSGYFHQAGIVTHDRPLGLGWDVAGRIEQVGADVTSLAVGDRVAGLTPAFDVPLAGLAEYAVLPAEAVAAVPESLTEAQAAALTLNALTAQQAIRLLGAPAGRSLLVTGAAGAVGGFALELLAGQDWEVTGLARESDADFVTARGAKLVTGPLADLGVTYDVVLDTASLQDAALAVVRPGGTFVGVQPSAVLPATEGRSVQAVGVVPDGEGLAELLDRAATGDLTVRIAGEVPLEQAATAFENVARGSNRGRWIVLPA